MTDRAPQEPLAYGTVATLEEARTAADDARRDGLRGKYPAALVVMDMAYARLIAQQAAPPQPRAPLTEDTARLDWLEAQKEHHAFCSVGYGDYRHYAHQQDGYPSVRAVIDEARGIKPAGDAP